MLVLTALGVLCTRRCFREDFPVAGGPTMMQGVTSTDTEPRFLRDFCMPVATLRGVEVHVMRNYNIVSPNRPCPYVLLLLCNCRGSAIAQ